MSLTSEKRAEIEEDEGQCDVSLLDALYTCSHHFAALVAVAAAAAANK